MNSSIMERITYSSRADIFGNCKECVMAQPRRKVFKKTTLRIAERNYPEKRKCRNCKKIVLEQMGGNKERALFEAIFNLGYDKTKIQKIVIIEKYQGEDEHLSEVKIEEVQEDNLNVQIEPPTTMTSPVFQSEYTEEELQQILEEACNGPSQMEETNEEMLHELLGTLEEDNLDYASMNLDDNAINQIYDDLLRSVDEVDNGHNYADEQERVASFKAWKCEYFTPQQMAAAGFYYTGEIDKVKCFACKTEICRWEPTDNPMEEHRKWGGRCSFLRESQEGNSSTAMGRDVCGRYDEGMEAVGINRENPENAIEKLKCKICWAQEIEMVLLPCGHAAFCTQCAQVLEKCAICRSNIEKK